MTDCVISKYLDDNEALSLREELFAAGIPSLVKPHGPPDGEYPATGGIYSLVQISGDDLERALPIVAQFNDAIEKDRISKNHELTVSCPKCRSRSITLHEKKSIFDKVHYFGVTVWQCNNCHEEWYT